MDHSLDFLALVDDAKTRIRQISIDDWLAQKPKPLLIDVREDDEWRAGHAASAEHLGKGVIERDICERVPNKSEKLVLYCGGGFRSALAADALQRMGYTEVRSLVGGYKAWLASNLPTEK